jgi:hypothetical protein
MRRMLLLLILAGFGRCAAYAAEASAESGKSEEKQSLLPFLELQGFKLGTRYSFVQTDKGVTSRNQEQHKEAFNFRIRFDRKGNYSLNAAVGTGASFTSGWDSLGIGSEANSHLNFRELSLSLKPWKGIELQYGGISVARGASTEITTYDSDSFLTGSRISIKKPKQLFFDEITATLAYLGDLNEPDVFHRFDRYDEANYHQIMALKKIGKRATVSGEYASQSGIATLRQAIQLKVPELKVIDAVRFENYQRIEGKKEYGFAVQVDRKLHKKVTVGGGFARIDRYYGGLNADRFNKGKRIFAIAKVDILDSLSAEVFIQQAVANNYAISNDIRLDLVLTYDLLPGLRKLGVFRIPK